LTARIIRRSPFASVSADTLTENPSSALIRLYPGQNSPLPLLSLLFLLPLTETTDGTPEPRKQNPGNPSLITLL